MYPDRVVLATVCVMLGVAVQYLPSQHIILESIAETHEDLGYKYYDVMRSALQRQSLEPRVYTLELVELLLLRAHFQSLCKTDSEEMWLVKGELMSIALAMGLHRDPSMWHMPRQLAERRRWCWWGLVALDRSVRRITSTAASLILEIMQMAIFLIWQTCSHRLAPLRHSNAVRL